MGWPPILRRLCDCFRHGISGKPTGYGVRRLSIYCCTTAGFEIPFRPEECKTCHLAGCLGWEEFALGDRRIEYHKGQEGYVPEAGDIVLYDRVFENKEHDHMGIVLDKREGTILVAEGNVNNISGIIERPIDEHIRAYIRIPDGYRYREE